VTPGFSTSYQPLTFVNVADRLTEAWTTGTTPVRKYGFGYDSQSNLSAVSTYDATGSTITSTTCLLHDPLGRLITVGPAVAYVGPDGLGCQKASDLASVSVRFRYDAGNRRVGRWDATTGAWRETTFGRDGNPLSELGWSGSAWVTAREYAWLDGRPLVQFDSGVPSYFHVDHLGLPRAITAAGGQVVWSAEARPYGDVVETVSTVVTNLRLPGQYDERLLGSLGLQGPYYNWNRWYLPGVGRYLEPDPIALEGDLNTDFGVDWYGYANQNPLRYTDPTGRCA
jgi:RHS repeat-associated protein